MGGVWRGRGHGGRTRNVRPLARFHLDPSLGEFDASYPAAQIVVACAPPSRADRPGALGWSAPWFIRVLLLRACSRGRGVAVSLCGWRVVIEQALENGAHALAGGGGGEGLELAVQRTQAL